MSPIAIRSAATFVCALSLLSSVGLARAAAPIPTGPALHSVSVGLLGVAPAVGAVAVDLPTQPGLSPDGKIVAFAWAGDLWCAPTGGGTATRLTAHPGEDKRPVFSPDGKKLAFESDRDGGRNLFVADVVSTGEGRVELGVVRRVTFVDRALSLSGWTSDSQELLLSANLDATAYRGTRMYRVALPSASGDAPTATTLAPIVRISEAFGGAPRMAADGSSIVFHRRTMDVNRPRYEGAGASDLWRLNTKDGTFTQLSTAKISDGDGSVLPDGRVLFVSSRSGTHNVWALPAGAADDRVAVQLTNFDPKTNDAKGLTIGHGVRDLAVSDNGKVAAFTVWDTMYTFDLATPGSKPLAFSATATSDEPLARIQRRDISKDVSEHAVSPDGKTLAVVTRGEVYIRGTDEGLPTRRVTSTSGRERDISWSPDGRVLWFSSDQSGSSQIYYATVTLAREDLTDKKEEPKEEPKAEEAKKDDVKKDDAKSPDAAAEKKDEPAGEAKGDGKTDPKADPKDNAKKELAKKKPDYAKRWAEAVRFEVHTLDVSKLAPGRDFGKYDGVLGTELSRPMPSPDGTKLLFNRGLGDLILIDLRTKEAKVLFDGWNQPAAQWAPDSRNILFTREDEDFNSDIFILDTQPKADGMLGDPANLTRHPDNDDSPSLSADGKVLYFRSERGRESDETQVYSVFLDKKLEGLRPYELEDYFKKAIEAAKKRKPIDPVLWDEPEPTKEELQAEAARKDEAKKDEAKKDDEKADPDSKDADKKDGDKKPGKKSPPKKPEPLKLDTADAFLRIRKIGNIAGSVGAVIGTPGGDRVLFSSGGEGEPQVISLSYKGDDRKVVITGAASDVALNLAGDRVTFIRAGAVSGQPIAGGKVDAYPLDAVINLDIAAQQRQKFREAARIMGNGFYHPTLKNLNWPGLTERYLLLAEKTRTNDEFDRVANMLMGELDGSHVGVRSPAGRTEAPAVATGYLGIDSVPDPLGHKVTRVLAQGAADRETSKLRPGDIITAVEGKLVKGEDLLAALAGRAGKETILDIIRAEGAKAATLIITPMANGEESDLRYRITTQDRRELVEKLSGGKLGYLHIRGMSEPYVRDFERDLFAAADGKLGLVIDVRDNGGGSTADILLSSLTAPRHAFTVNRGQVFDKVKRDAYPRDRRLIYGYTRPISLLINEYSYSNAEIFAHAIKTIGRGKLVGVATYGAVISTGQATLVDGTTVRTPFRGWYLPDGRDFENNGATPDIDSVETPSNEAAGRDTQIETSVKELLSRLNQ